MASQLGSMISRSCATAWWKSIIHPERRCRTNHFAARVAVAAQLPALSACTRGHAGLVFDWGLFRWRCIACLLVLYLLPPAAARLIQILASVRQGHIRLGSRDFFVWWALINLQVLFSRLPALEEGLRLVPGLYSLWMRYGVRRSFVSLGGYVIFGAAVRNQPAHHAAQYARRIGIDSRHRQHRGPRRGGRLLFIDS